MALTGKQNRYLRSLAHHLEAVVRIGHDGLSDAILGKIEEELEEHELIKVKVGKGPLNRKTAAAALSEKTGAEIAQILGKTILLYRARKKNRGIRLPPDKTWIVERTDNVDTHQVHYRDGKIWRHRIDSSGSVEKISEEVQGYIDRFSAEPAHQPAIDWLVNKGLGISKPD